MPKKKKSSRKSPRPRSPMPPPSKPAEKVGYQRTEEKESARKEMEEE